MWDDCIDNIKGMEDITRIVKSPEELGLLIKRVSDTITNEGK